MDLKINEEDTICLLEYAPDTFKWNDNVQPVCLSDSFDPERTCYSAKGLKLLERQLPDFWTTHFHIDRLPSTLNVLFYFVEIISPNPDKLQISAMVFSKNSKLFQQNPIIVAISPILIAICKSAVANKIRHLIWDHFVVLKPVRL